MNPDLTIVLPIQNIVDTVSGRLGNLLEVVSALKIRFEVIVVDDGSSDLTWEVVAGYCREFPQIRMKRHLECRGVFSSIRSGFGLARAKTIFVQQPDLDISPAALRRFWESKAPNNLLEISSRQPIRAVDDQLLDRLSSWCSALKKEKSERLAEDRSNRVDQQENLAAKPKLRAPSGVPTSNSTNIFPSTSSAD